MSLDFHQVDALARQAVDLLLPEAELTIVETPRSNAYVYPQATGGDPGSWRITVSIAPDSQAVLTLDGRLAPAAALAELVSDLSGASGGHFRGRPFPECPGHDHPARVAVAGETVEFTCPDDGRVVANLRPAVS